MKIKCVKIANGSGWLCLPAKNLIEGFQCVLGEDFDELEIGDQVTIDVVEMTQAEIDALPEFNG